MGVKYKRNDDGTLTQESDGGYKALVIDPDGSFEREMQPPNPEAYAAIAPDIPRPSGGKISDVSPTDAAALAQPSSVGPTASIVERPDQPSAAPQVAPLAPQAAAPAPQMVTLPGAPGQTKTESNTSSGGSTSGLDAPSKAAVEAAGAKSRTSEEAAIAAEGAAKTQVSADREARAKQDYMSGYTKQVGSLEAEDRYKRAYQEALDERKAARATKLDPSQAFGSEKASWGFIAGLEGALSALDIGIARLQKRGAPPPSDLIEKMVENSLKLQTDARSQRIAGAGESADAAHEGLLAAQSNTHEAAAQVLESRKMMASSSDEAAFLDAEIAKQRSAADLKDEERAKTLATKSTSQWAKTQQTTTAAGGGGGQMLVVPGSERAAQDQKLIQDTLSQAYPGLKPKDSQGQWDDFQKQYLGTTAMRSAVQRAQEAIADSAKSGDVPGFGPIAKHIPTDFASLDAVQKRQAVGQAISLYVKSISGAAATDKEAERLLTNIAGSGDYATMKSGLDGLASFSNATDQEMQKTKPQLYKLADYLGKRQGDERGSGKAAEVF